jgi:hypothetical protein
MNPEQQTIFINAHGALESKGSGRICLDGCTAEIVKLMMAEMPHEPFFLPNIFLDFDDATKKAVVGVVHVDPMMAAWWNEMCLDYCTMNDRAAWKRSDIDIVWEAEIETYRISAILLSTAGRVYVVCAHTGAIQSEAEWRLNSHTNLDDHLRGNVKSIAAHTDLVLTVIRGPMEVRELTVSDGTNVRTIRRRGPQGVDADFWVKPNNETVLLDEATR